MKLDELKELMNTDARQRAEAQEKTIKELHKKIADQQREIDTLRSQLKGGTK